MTTPIDRESVERLAYRLSEPQSAIRPTISDSRDGAKTLLALRAALDAADRLADVLNDLLNSRGHCFIPNKIGGRKDWDDDANEALAAYRALQENPDG